MTTPEDANTAACGSPVERWVGRPVPERYNVSVGGAERASESDSRHPADGDPYTTAHAITAEQREIMRHALGYGRRSPPGWRNHFVTGPGSTDYDNCEALVAAGLMAKRSGGPLSGGDPVYRVTDAGMDALVGRKTPNAELRGRPLADGPA